MGVAVAILLGAVAVAAVLVPFLQKRGPRPQTGLEGPEALQELLQQKEAVYQEIHTLQLEHDLGHVPEEEFRRRLHALRLRAAEFLRQQELVALEVERASKELEAEVRALRTPSEAKGLCPHCQEPLDPGTLVCSACGFSLSAFHSPPGAPS